MFSAKATFLDVELEDVMLDLESYATGPTPTIIQIGGVLFDSRKRVIGEAEFLCDVIPESCKKFGGITDLKTVNWWKDQGGFHPVGEPQHIITALLGLRDWIEQFPKVKRVWAQGIQFDIAALEGFYQRMGIREAWPYNAGRDTRSIYELARWKGWDKPKGAYDVSHQAVEDCRVQIKTLFSALDALEVN